MSGLTREQRGESGRRVAARLACCALVAVVPLLCRPARGAAADAPAAPSAGLAKREQDLARQFRDLERTFLRLADLLAASDPRRAALLRSVFEQAREAEVGERLDTIVKLLEQGQLLKAGTGQSGALDALRELLSLLESGDTDKRRATEKEEVRQFLNRLAKVIARQRDVEGSTEAGAAEAKLSERQAALADETQRLAGDIGGFAKRMEPKDPDQPRPDEEPGGRKQGREPAEGQDKPGQDKPGQDKPGQDKPGQEGADREPPSGRGEADGEGKPSRGADAAGEGEDAEAGESGAADAQAAGDDEASRARRTARRLAAAERRMRQARRNLDDAKRRDARQEQEKAIEELETARAELEEILRQMREQEVERLLVQLEARLRAMLRAERAVLESAEKLAAEPAGPDRERQIEAVRLSREQNTIGTDAAKALTLVRDDGSAVAIPEALEQVRDDSGQAAARLARGDVGGTTRGILQDLVANLEEMLAALEKAQAEQQKRQAEGAPQGRPAEPGEQPLVDKLAELKMIRSLQMRVNTRTKRFAKLLADGAEQAEEPELLDALDRLAERQHKIERAAHDIVVGRTE
jgi:hypothetical protein